MQKHVNLVDLVKSFPTNIIVQNLASIQKRTSPIIFFRIGRSNLTKKLEKVEGPFECDELEKHCRVSAKCYPTTIPALYTMTKEKFKKSSMLPEITD